MLGNPSKNLHSFHFLFHQCNSCSVSIDRQKQTRSLHTWVIFNELPTQVPLFCQASCSSTYANDAHVLLRWLLEIMLNVAFCNWCYHLYIFIYIQSLLGLVLFLPMLTIPIFFWLFNMPINISSALIWPITFLDLYQSIKCDTMLNF